MDRQISSRPSGITPVSTLSSTNRSPTSTAAFNNSLIADLIFLHLDSSDTCACLAVCKDWNTLFQRYHWQSISHYYIYQRGGIGCPPNQWWESRDKQVNARVFQCVRNQPKHSNSRSLFISRQQKELIYRNAFRVRSLKLLFKSLQPRRSPSSTTITKSTTNASAIKLHSLKLNIFGGMSFADICWVVENCPPSLQQLTVQCSAWTKQGNFYSTGWSDNLDQRFTWMKSNDNTSFQQHLPALRRLDLSWHSSVLDGKEINLVDPEKFLFPLLACFPSLQDMTVPKITSRLLDGGSTLIPALATHCPALTTVNFGENLISEDHMFRFIMYMSRSLQGLTARITPSYLTRVLPALLKRSGPTLQHLRLAELGFDESHLRSTYIADILACCPRLKTLFVLPKAQPASTIGTQDLLGAKWICSGLETLSISINELTVAVASESETLHEHLETAFAAVGCEEIRSISDFYKRLKTLPFLRALDLRWSPACQMALSVSEKASFSDELLTVDNLKWMGFSLS
ncbi:hypothetical protein BKA57DRAFT_503942 [Linnemannia elongata]|nr:hypothetical protein BKA57DRAFT_503942 [Linnemannia elongata]